MRDLFIKNTIKCMNCRLGKTGLTIMCYACKNSLTNTIKNEYGDFWECQCKQNMCTCDYTLFYCPICNREYKESNYLAEAITDIKVRWLANMITHYRHDHITSWNKCWAEYGNNYRRGWFGDYEEEKKKVNERAKRQIIRKCFAYLSEHGINADHFQILQNTTPETLELINNKIQKI